MFHEFPKAMYRSGEYMAVASAEQEAAAAKKGWTNYYADCERMASPKEETGDLESLRAKATALGIKVHHLWKEPRLREEIAKAE